MMNQPNKKIALFANTSWYLHNFRNGTLDALINKGYIVYCICPDADFKNKLELKGCKVYHIYLSRKGLNPFGELYSIYLIIKTYYKIKPNFIFHFTIKPNIYGSIAATILGLNFANNITGLGSTFQNTSLLTKIIINLYKISNKKAKCVYFQNTADLEMLCSLKAIKYEQAALLPGSGIDLEKFNNANFESSDLAATPKKFGYIGRFIYEKGIEYLIHAFIDAHKNNPDIELLLCGYRDLGNPSCIEQEKIDEWSKHESIHILPRTDNPVEFFANLDCFILPSFGEGLPKTILEAFAMKVPVIATDVKGISDIIIDNINGLLSKSHDHKSLCNNIEKMINFPMNKRLQIIENAYFLVSTKYMESIVVEEALKQIEKYA